MQDTKGDFIRGGLIAGAIGGAVLALVMILPVLGNAQVTWPSLQFASYPFIGPQIFHKGFDGWAMALGTVVHFAIAMGWSLLFTFAVRKTTRLTTLLLSVPFGALVWAVMYFVVLPIIHAVGYLEHVPDGIGLVQHVLYGLAVGLTLVLLQPQNFRFGRTTRELAA